MSEHGIVNFSSSFRHAYASINAMLWGQRLETNWIFVCDDGVVSVAVGQVKGKSEEEPDDDDDDEGGGGHCVGVALKQVKPASIEVKSEAAVVYFDEGLDH